MGFAVDEALVARGVGAADDANGVEFLHVFRHGQESGHGAEGLAAEIRLGARQDHLMAHRGQRRRDMDDRVIQKLGLVDRDHIGLGAHQPHDLGGGVHRQGAGYEAVAGRDLGHPCPRSAAMLPA